MTQRDKVIKRLKKRARFHVRKSTVPAHLDCGRHMADILRGTNTDWHLKEADRYINRLKRIDPEFPK